MSKRMPYLDSIRFLACTWVFINHFFDDMSPMYLMLWKIKPYSYFLGGFIGKVGVATFAVILGFLAAKSGAGKSKSFLRYTVNRYIYFLIAGLLAGVLLMCFYKLAPANMWVMQADFASLSLAGAAKLIVSDAIKLGCTIYETFWFIKPFFYASIICFILGMFDVTIIPMLILDFILYTTGQGWIAICTFGAVLYRLVESGILSSFLDKRYIRIILIAAAVVILKLFPEESAVTYYFDGIACTIFLFVVFHSSFLQKILTWNKLNAVTKNYMAFLILHRQVFHALSALINGRFAGILQNPGWMLAIMLLCYIVTVALSIPFDYILNSLYKFACRVAKLIPFEKLESRAEVC